MIREKQRRSVARLFYEQFEARLCLSAISFASHDIIASEANVATAVFAADLDGDGDEDVLSASYAEERIAWHENIDGNGTFGPQRGIATDDAYAQVLSLYAIDIDGDGDLDVLAASSGEDNIAWYENVDGKGTFSEQKLISAPAAADARSVHAVDVDGDGDIDVLSASAGDDKIAWYENADGKGTFGQQQIITIEVSWARSVYAADLDGDGDADVLSASAGDDKIAWYENIDGKGSYGPQRIITTDANGPWSVFAADLDGDGDVDVLSASDWDHKIAWYENTDAKGTFSDQQVITTQEEIAWSVSAADLDGDGDVDVVAADSWYENTDGAGSFGEQRPITPKPDMAGSVYTADLDGDGDVDLLFASAGVCFGSEDTAIVWYENADGRGVFDRRQVLMDESGGPISVSAVDVDGDGDTDVLSGFSLGNKVAWYENTDGKGTFGPQQVIATEDADGVSSLCAADFDGDGDVDVLAATLEMFPHRVVDKIAWYEQYRSAAGDANRDREFNQLDIVQVLQGAKYLTREPATWHQGDWNGDGLFDQLDIVAAVATGHYLHGPYAASAADTVFAVNGT